MKTLVTGGAGFIGSNLCEHLLNRGDDVICFDSLSTGSIKNVEDIKLNNNNLIFVHDDVRNNDVFENDLFSSVDKIYHLACPASPLHYQADPIGTIETNFLGTKNLLLLAKRINAKILIASTSEIYGDPLVHPQTEDYFGNVNPVGIRSCYDEGKRIGESLAFEHRRSGVDVRIARIFNTYGPRMSPNDGRMIPNFIWNSIHGKKIEVYGDGEQTRSLCYVDDMVRGLHSLMEVDSNSLQNEFIFNLGNPDERTVNSIAHSVMSHFSSHKGVINFPLPQNDPKKRCPSIQKAKKLLNWEPKITFEVGLHETLNWFYGLSSNQYAKENSELEMSK